MGLPPVPRVPLIQGFLLTWEPVGVYRGPILYYTLMMNNSLIYNGSYLENGFDLRNVVQKRNYYFFLFLVIQNGI